MVDITAVHAFGGQTAAEAQPGPSTVRRVLVPLGPEQNHSYALLVANVLSTWLDASLQVVVGDDQDLGAAQALAFGLGVPVEPAVAVADPLGDDLVRLAEECAPSLVVIASGPKSIDYARRATQPVLLVGDVSRHRAPTGPLLVEITGDPADDDAAALAAVYAAALDQTIRLMAVVDVEGDELPTDIVSALAAQLRRLREMGCDVGIDAFRPHNLVPLVLVGRSRQATAIVIPGSRLEEHDLIAAAADKGVNVLVAPSNPSLDRPAAAATVVDHGRHLLRSQLDEMTDQECLDHLRRHSVARLGYVEDGWPTVLPVNYRVAGEDVYIKTLEGGKLRAAERGDVVCLELDGVHEVLREGWSVVVHGTLEVIHDPSVLRDAWRNDPMPWVEAGNWRWLRLVPFQFGGRRLEAIPSQAPSDPAPSDPKPSDPDGEPV
ncbi:MAG: pyridoxamine 5'-phosphate oxidase family protein [Actinomycetota bacterium]